MLKQLYIKNYTLIDTLDMAFHPGFSVITGETGAGKSIILGALSLLLGQRADSKMIKSGADRCIIEAHFDLRHFDLKSFFDSIDIDYDEADCILRRELTSSGKSRAFINDSPVSLIQLKQLGQQLVDIHSQHKNLLLQEEDFQLNVVDLIAGNKELFNEYQNQFKEYQHSKKALDELKERIARASENEDYLRFQINELNEANLKEGMQESLEKESEMMSHAEEIKSALYSTETILSNEERCVISDLKEIVRSLENIQDVYPDISESIERIESCLIELKDISKEINNQAEHVEYDPHELESINEKLDCIYSLEKKHRVDSVEKLIEIRDNIASQLDQINNSDEELKRMEENVEKNLNQCKTLASKLSTERIRSAKVIEKEMINKLVPLGIPHVRFKIQIEPKQLQADGSDRINFLFSANTNTDMQPIKDVASGGEISRVMLSLKAMISGAVNLPTIIFDEIDTGVSGKIAEKMAIIMKEMGHNNRQVISITHLPQIAAMGTSHYKVYKEESANGTISRMSILNQDERVSEIAQMLSGETITESAINQAKELLKLA